MGFLTKDDILSINDSQSEIINVPEWGEDVQVRVSVMPGHVREKYEQASTGKNGGPNTENWRARLVAYTLIDESGDLLFTPKEVIKLNHRSGVALDRIFDVAARLNKMSDQDVDDLAKN